LLVLLPAWASARVIICQVIAACATLTLQGAVLVRTSHPHEEQRIVQSPALQQPPPTQVTGKRYHPQVILGMFQLAWEEDI